MAAPPEPAPRGLGRKKRHHLVRLGLITLGWCLVAIGLAGGLIPVFQGWPFGVAGALILYVESRWFQRKVRAWRQRHPAVNRTWHKARAWVRKRRPRRGANGAPDGTAAGAASEAERITEL
ncbi:hypothetical protein FBQ97_07410 [Acidobacteria bacterium ACD]|nr:MAG: hypothetical protein EDX89_09350 [Acidobacteriota bacterium]MCE7960518.1 hypothetical protein [Acidobacteria bacterium ACB2]MDL1949626.1 hypothetical protein [Acidobacteria bacterium ACD]